jgi:BirA family biotin operon repressor/biotin-[acetyl-CoA-carboxylase] ligase
MVFVGADIIRLDSVDSTNNYAARLVELTRPSEGTAIVAQYQQAGRGQRGHTWQSDFGKNLMVSFILYPKILSGPSLFDVNRTIALSLHDTCAELCPFGQFTIKWPNDLYAGNLKVGGILLESSSRGSVLDYVIAGIGLNIDQQDFNGLQATSLLNLCGEPGRKEEALYILRSSLHRRYGELTEKNGAENIRRAFEHNLKGRSAFDAYSYQGKRIQAKVKKTAEDGGLYLQTECGETLGPFQPRDISWINPEIAN